MATITLRAKEGQKRLIAEYAKMHDISMSSFMLSAALEKIEDDLDLRDMEEAMREHEKNPVTYTLAEVREHLDL